MQHGNKVRIIPAELVEFYDTKPKESGGAANAINAVAGEDLGNGLLKHYFENAEGASVAVLPEQPKSIADPQTGSRFWLDRWLMVEWTNRKLLFQVEIKNWSAHSLDGKPLGLSASSEQIRAYKIKAWEREWNDGLRKPATRKVLLQMKPPKGFNDATPEPLLCMWAAMHPNGESDPFFEVEVRDGRHFKRLYVFSMSAYLRTLTCPHLEIEMPKTIERLRLLNRLFVYNL